MPGLDSNLSNKECVIKMVDFLKQVSPSPRMRQAGISQFNFLLLGRMGMGKSALATTIYSCFKDKYVEQFRIISGA